MSTQRSSPREARKLNFRPDPSCSDTTFIGSSTDMSALAAQLLDSALDRLDLRPGASRVKPPHRSLSVVRLGNNDDLKPARVVLDLPPDRVVMDHGETYEVRVDEAAMETMREHIRASANGRTAGAGHTGGLLAWSVRQRVPGRVGLAGDRPATGQCTADPLQMNLEMAEVRDFLR